MGLSLVPEGRHVFATLTVEENLAIGTYMRRDRAAAAAELTAVLERFPKLRERRHFPAGKLSGGEQQMLVIARAMLYSSAADAGRRTVVGFGASDHRPGV